jgi:hypothetical protein
MSESVFRSRIVGHDDVDPKTLLANPLNWRVHPQHQRSAISDVLTQVGWVQDVIVNKTTGHMVDGHLRVEIAVERNEPTVPVEYVELSEDEERLVLATLDPLAGLAIPNSEALEQLLADLKVDGESLQGLLEDLLQAAGEPPPVDPVTPGDEDFWPRVTLKLPPDVHARWQEMMGRLEGDEDHEKITVMLDELDS